MNALFTWENLLWHSVHATQKTVHFVLMATKSQQNMTPRCKCSDTWEMQLQNGLQDLGMWMWQWHCRGDNTKSNEGDSSWTKLKQPRTRRWICRYMSRLSTQCSICSCVSCGSCSFRTFVNRSTLVLQKVKCWLWTAFKSVKCGCWFINVNTEVSQFLC